MVTIWSTIFVKKAKEYILTKIIIVRPGEPPWLTDKIKRVIKKRNRVHITRGQKGLTAKAIGLSSGILETR